MAAVEIFKFPISSPADTTPLDRLKDAGYDASQILAVVGKTEGVFSPLSIPPSTKGAQEYKS
ncbi:uncharacterized protein Z520_02255 [Fonsecaea multimorphosa CBS 102226]|uniref:Uncharacterized protein n=1 Tax=Fonsecaea multimorphosa CBS 102226 TaxID=1442371 RepID=A0A0D2IYJ1_9EURO|nr:uncharacterized protein Z520_02255 [Fonsecaea multimorphosa CBS 102226]KIY02117.1 hypothetical protein Z520_02255 [Fonsecaea multimorphosa CBS 102226]